MPCTLLSQHRLYRCHPSCGLNSLDPLPDMQVMEDIAMPLPCNVHTSCIRYVVSSVTCRYPIPPTGQDLLCGIPEPPDRYR